MTSQANSIIQWFLQHWGMRLRSRSSKEKSELMCRCSWKKSWIRRSARNMKSKRIILDFHCEHFFGVLGCTYYFLPQGLIQWGAEGPCSPQLWQSALDFGPNAQIYGILPQIFHSNVNRTCWCAKSALQSRQPPELRFCGSAPVPYTFTQFETIKGAVIKEYIPPSETYDIYYNNPLM